MKKPRLNGSHSIPGLFVFVLVGLFAVSALLLTLTGTRVYRHVADAGAQSTQAQTLMSYLCNKLHAYDMSGSVTVEERAGLNALCLREELDGEAYTTLIYAYDGAVYEQLLWEGDAFDPEQGERIAEAQALRFELSPEGMATLAVTEAGGERRELHVALRAAPEGGA